DPETDIRVPRDEIARSGPADLRIRVRSARDLEPEVPVADKGRSQEVGADEIALHDRPCAGIEERAMARVARAEVSIGGIGSTDDEIRREMGIHALGVSENDLSRGVRSDEAAGDLDAVVCRCFQAVAESASDDQTADGDGVGVEKESGQGERTISG